MRPVPLGISCYGTSYPNRDRYRDRNGYGIRARQIKPGSKTDAHNAILIAISGTMNYYPQLKIAQVENILRIIIP
jgi:hypothetical protein